jgi:[ribosomal protein S5]-alanine N-acetyltransferase
MTELRTDRLVLRRARPDDLSGLHAVFSDERAMQYWSSGPHNDVEETRTWLQSMIKADPDESDEFVVTANGAVIGKLGCWRLPEIGFILRSDHWGKGLGSEAMKAFLLHVFTAGDISRVTADVDPRNKTSIKLLRSHGFVETGRAKGTWNTHIGLGDSVYLALNHETAQRYFNAD